MLLQKNKQNASRENKFMELNVKPGTLIILFCDRNDLFLTAFLGVFKSGGAYIPLSTDWPDKRRDFYNYYRGYAKMQG